ncbi:MAG: hypothetical protein ABI904_17545 [Chloroflexota bacterium]
MKITKITTCLIIIGVFCLISSCTQTPTTAPIIITSHTSTPTQTPSSPFTDTITPTLSSTNTPELPNPTAAIEATISSAVFPVGPGGADVIPHQIVRTNNDYLYIFTSQQSSKTLRVYRTSLPGLPNTTSDFAPPIELNESSEPISVDALYDGGQMIHVLINTQAGEVKDYPFDTVTNTFLPSITLAENGGTVSSGLYIGTCGISGMVDTNGVLHILYWTSNDHILYGAYTYNSAANTLVPNTDFLQVDADGNANHPVLAISPRDGSMTTAWVSQTSDPAQILARTYNHAAGTWSDIEPVSTAPVWVSSDNGINIDQGPSLLIDQAGTKHLTYIEQIDYSVGDYGRIHYVMNNGSGWVDQGLNAFSHDPVLAINSADRIYIIGHGHPLNPTCKSMNEICTIQKNETWASPTSFAFPPSGFSFDSSPSVKWSIVGFNRPNVIEFIFFMTPYDNSTVYYGRLP